MERDAHIVVLGLYLKELGIKPQDIDEKFENRRIAQRAIYLTQYAGADLGYRYKWFSQGPFSPDLHGDYQELVLTSLVDLNLLEGKELVDSYTTVIQRLQNELFSHKKIPDLKDHQWLDLLGTFHYLQKISGFSPSKARAFLKKEKPGLSKYLSQANSQLRKSGLL